jgi:four helix bundle protein
MNPRALTDLDVYKEYRTFRKSVADIMVKCFPSDEKYRLTDQVIRLSRAVTANIAEGNGRFYYLENIKFCGIIRGSLE